MCHPVSRLITDGATEYNETLYPEPEKFMPSRWYSTPSNPKPSDAFTAFSFGPRVCIGQNFSKTEGVAFISSLLKEWRLDIKLKEGETRDMYEKRVMDAHFVMTLSTNDIPVVLKKRRSPHH
jgi:cytochrome P450